MHRSEVINMALMREVMWEDTNEYGLPPGFRFHPTDEELLSYYLAPKVLNGFFFGMDMAEVDLNRCEPWELPEVAKMGEREWYFFSLRDRKYPTGLRTNRATISGYWKATGKDREVCSASTGTLLGMKKTLVFYKGRAPKGEKTKWVMHEYRVDSNILSTTQPYACKDEWVMCRILHKVGDKSLANKNLRLPMQSPICLPLLDYSNISCSISQLESRLNAPQILNQVQPSPILQTNSNPFSTSTPMPIPSLIFQSSLIEDPCKAVSIGAQFKSMQVQPSNPILLPQQPNLITSSSNTDRNHHRPSIIDLGNGFLGLSSSPTTAANSVHDSSTSTKFNRAGLQMLDPYYVAAGLGKSEPLLL